MIEVEGRIAASYSTRLEGMQITENRAANGIIKTTLVGRLQDQAALSGVLNTLYELHATVVLVTCMEGRDRSGDR